METLCGMLNSMGGIVIFGISNKGKIIGQNISDKTTREIGEALTKFDPAIDLQPIYIPLESEDKYLIAFHACGLESDQPYLWDGKAYQRHDSVTSVMPREKFFRLHELRQGLKYKWETETNPRLSIDTIDSELILSIVRSAVRRGRLSSIALNDSVHTALERFKLTRDGFLLNSAAVLFGKDFTDYPQCRLRLARFSGTTKQHFIDNQQHEGNIFELVDAAMAFFFKHLMLSGTTHNRTVREDELEIPYDALRESVVNAYCHMNWGYETATVGIAIYDDRVDIENAGHFPVRISPNSLMQAEEENRQNTSLPPNPIIADVLYLGGLIEHWGRGLSLMASECERAGLPTPKFSDNGSIIRVSFIRPLTIGRSKSGVSRSKSEVSDTLSSHPLLGAGILRLIAALGENQMSSFDLCEVLGYKSRNTFVRQYLKPAIEGGLISLGHPDKRHTPTQRYCLTLKGKAISYDRKNIEIEKESEPINTPLTRSKSKSDPLKSVIEAIKANPRISRSQLAKISGCSESTIKRRLKENNIAWVGHSTTGHWVFIKDIQ